LVAVGRWDESRLGETAASLSDHDDTVSKASGIVELASGAFDQHALQAVDQSECDRPIRWPCEYGFCRPLEVENLPQLS
jgi:hypothetical protein